MNSPPLASAASELQIAAEVEAERRQWRDQVLVGLLRTAGVALSVSAAWMWFNREAVIGAPASMLAVAALTLAWARAVPYRIRVAFLLLALIGVSTLAIVRFGATPNALVALCAVAVFAAVLLGRGWGLLAVVATSAIVGLVGAFHVAGLAPRRADWIDLVDFSRVQVVMRVFTIYIFATTVLVLAPSAVIRRAEALALEKARSLAALAREQAERARAQAELVRREAAYHKAQELEVLGRLSATVAHDFNNALGVILAAVGELENGKLPGRLGEAVADLRAGAEQAAATTRQLRVFGPAADRPPTLIALAPLMQRACAALGRVLPGSIEVAVEIRSEPMVRADEGQLLRIITNLALNARDAMRDGGRLTLRLREVADGVAQVAVDVADTGAGMSEEVKAHLFEPYFTTKGDQGTGLGLASVRQIVEAAGGHLKVESAVGRGTTVTVLWPAAAS